MRDSRGLPAGIYRLDYGNAALVAGPRARSAWDLDAGVRVPLRCVSHFLRPLRPGERAPDRAPTLPPGRWDVPGI